MARFRPKRNTNIIDRSVRLVIGVFLMIVAAPGVDLLGGSIFKLVIFLFGALNVATAFSGWCVVYHMAGISSNAAADDSEK